VPGRCRASQIVDAVDAPVDLKRLAYVMLELWVVQQRANVAQRSRKLIIDADHMIPSQQQRVADMGSDKARAAGDDGAAREGRMFLAIYAGLHGQIVSVHISAT
jgi:hypothetical protein